MGTISELEFIEKLNRLKAILFRFEKTDNGLKSNILKELISILSDKPHSFMQFHQTLMCLLAYPGNKDILELTKKTISDLIDSLSTKKLLQEKLTGTGLFHTSIECNFTFSKINYLIQHSPNQVSIHSAASGIETQKAVLKLLLPNVEYSKIHDGEKDFKTRIRQFHSSNKPTDLEWLLKTIHSSGVDLKTQSFLYNELGIFIQWKISAKEDSVSFLRGTDLPVYFHTTPPDKKIDFQSVVSQKLPAPVKLSLKEKKQLIHSAKMSLLYLYRETEPFTNANENDITLFHLDKGISIALFGSTVDKRYSLESYIGYLVLKNNIPVSYGGGWIFGQRSQFGINILEAFRGGESTLIICELLRVYHQYFGITRFVVKPYQFGLHNPEAIKTGAFWFYYKLGFRPENQELKKLALQEEESKKTVPGYKSDANTLRKYTKSNIALTLSATSFPHFDSEELSKKISVFINTNFDGNRELALTQCFKQFNEGLNIKATSWKKEDVNYAKEMSLLFCMSPNSKIWLKKNKKAVMTFIQLKSAKTELSWIKHLQKFKAFWDLMNSI
ncbi:MAG: hypothetical protein V4565_10465 [Bacteroidota bacterium]